MKKRLIAVLLCAAFLAALSWGSPYGADRGETYDLYFREADLSAAPGGDALRAEELHLEAEETQSALSVAERLMDALLAGPEDPTLVRVIPEDTTLLSLELDGGRAKVDLSSRYRNLSGVSLATSFPWEMIIICPHTARTSESMWLLSMTVRCSPSSCIKSRISIICLGSSPTVGSSSITASGEPSSAWAMPTRWR